MVDALLREEIGKTIAGINDGKTYMMQVHSLLSCQDRAGLRK